MRLRWLRKKEALGGKGLGLVHCGMNDRGLRNGVCIIHDGDTTKTVTYKDGIANGYFSVEEKGVLLMEGRYTDGMIDGDLCHYDDRRVEICSQRFSLGKEI